MTKIFEALEQANRDRMAGAGGGVGGNSLRGFPPCDVRVQEAMIGLFQNIRAQLGDMEGRSLLFLGSSPGEGTSTLAGRFAQVCVQQLHKTVALLDADQAAPAQLPFFQITPRRGWEEAVLGQAPMEEVLLPVGGDERFRAGQVSLRTVSSPPVFDQPGFDGFLATLQQGFDLVVVDGPPVLDSSDGLALARKVDGVVLVIESERTRWEVAQSVRDRIAKQGGNLVGAILNKRRFPIPHFIYRMI